MTAGLVIRGRLFVKLGNAPIRQPILSRGGAPIRSAIITGGSAPIR